MKWLSVAACGVFLLISASAFAQETGIQVGISPGDVGPTPEMWFYEKYQQDYLDPKMQVRKNAEFRGAQRRARLAAMQWFGFSNSRPRVGTDPYHGDYAPCWTSNNSAYPFRWSGVGQPWYTASPPRSTFPDY